MIVEKKPLTEEAQNGLAKDLYLSLLRQGNFIYVDAWGGSMYPFVKNGDRIKIEPVDKEKIRPGDIVAVDREDRVGVWFIAHRVVKITGDKGNRIYFTKGDANTSGIDKAVAEELILGRITEASRKNLSIRFESCLWRIFNAIIARLSLRHPKLLLFLSRYISLIIEWRLFFSKAKNTLDRTPPLLRNAQTLLLLCARKELDEISKKRATVLIKEGLDWQYFCECTLRSGTTVLVYNSLKSIKFYAYIPEFVFKRLKDAYLYILTKATIIHNELLEVLGLFAKKNIPAIPLKGTFLSQRIYGDIAAHGLSSDIDLLIAQDNKEVSRALLEQAGYSFSPNLSSIIQSQDNFTKNNSTPIDLHWDIMMLVGRTERKDVFLKGARLRYEEKSGLRYYELKEEELLLYLANHLASNCSFRWLRYVCDINELLSKYKSKLDWDSAIKKAIKWRLSGSLFLALRLSKKFFNTEVEPELLRKVKPHLLASTLIELFANKRVVFHQGRRRRLIDSLLSYVFLELIEARSPKEYLYIFKRIFLPSKETIGNRSHIGRIFKIILRVLMIFQFRKAPSQ